jgi:ABC-type branched-subunit amino acid transport system substrate-binding protein
MFRGAVVGAVCIGLLASACGSSSKSTAPSSTSATTTSGGTAPSSTAGDTTGVTSSTINVAEIADVSGPVPGLFQGAQFGIQAWEAYVNATGGIDGRKVSVTLKDSALSCPTYQSSLASAQSSTFASVGSYAIFDSCGKSVLTAHPGYPDIQGAVLTPAMNALPNVFTPVPSPPGFATTGYQYVKDKFPADIVHTAALYGAAVTQDYDEQSNAAKSLGYKYVYVRGLGNTETNFTSDVLRMKSDGIKIVDMQDCDAIEVADFLQEAQQQGLHIDALFSAAAYDPNFFTELGKADATPLVMALPVALYLGGDSSVPTVANFIKYFDQTHPGSKPNLFAVEAFVAGLLFEQAMKAAGPNPSRAALLTQLGKVTTFDAGGLIGPTNPGGKVPGVCAVIAGVANGAYIRVKPATSGFTCDGTFVPYTATS